MIGRVVLDRYVIEAEIASGAMGTVYRGKHAKLPRQVAIKVMHPDLGRDPTLVERFRREARVAARLSHPNVIEVIDIGESDDGSLLMVMELARGRQLSKLVDGRPMDARRVVAIVRQLLLGLEHAHEAGLVHRDLKPDNVIVEDTADGDVPKIVDFGIAILAKTDSIDGLRLTTTGNVVGTPLYMAPEQAKCEPVDRRADLFSLGVMTYEMLGGRVPFDGNATEIAVANINFDPPSIAERTGVRVDPLLERFARKLMARELHERFPTAYEALRVLDQLERDRDAASLALGLMNVQRALATISLPGSKR